MGCTSSKATAPRHSSCGRGNNTIANVGSSVGDTFAAAPPTLLGAANTFGPIIDITKVEYVSGDGAMPVVAASAYDGIIGKGANHETDDEESDDLETVPTAADYETDGRDDFRALSSLSSRVSVNGRYHKDIMLENDYTVLQDDVLGTGMNGSVFRAKSKHEPDTYAVKGFKVQGLNDQAKKRLFNEVNIFLAMDHPHVVRLIDVYENSDHIHLVMECMEGGEVLDRLCQQPLGWFTEKDAARSLWQMLLAINYLHTNGIVHADIKPENFLYQSADADLLKLIDFGLSTVYGQEALTGGTLSYASPEMVRRERTTKSDLWSIGCVAYVLLCGRLPFDGPGTKILIERGQFNKKQEWYYLNEEAQDFIQRCLEPNTTKRMSAEDALRHAFIAGHRHNSSNLAKPIGANIGVSSANAILALMSFSQTSRFRRACLSLMAWSLTPEERSKAYDAFIELDVNKRGSIGLQDLRQVLAQNLEILSWPLDEADLEEIIGSLAQTSQDGVIHYSEFLAATVANKFMGISFGDDKIRATFRRFDSDNKGFLTASDFSNVLDDSSSEEEVWKDIAAFSSNSSTTVPYDTFSAFLNSRPGFQPSVGRKSLCISMAHAIELGEDMEEVSV